VSNTIRVGPATALEVNEITALRPVWLSGDRMVGSFECQAQLRAHGEPIDAIAEVVEAPAEDGSGRTIPQLRVRLDSPATGIAAGQAVVLYRPDGNGDVVIASATIQTSGNTAMTSVTQ
jgi:tRNA-specific 2-thiouridylase